jgi:PTH1 family peptidyl-tRNA hydrolase
MKIVVGLGNPGAEYARTRHNFGFMFLEYLEQKYKFNIDKKKLDSLIGECTINDEKVVFVKPTTFMNLSGNAVVKIKNWYKVENKDIIVIFDDIDIDFEDIRYKASGSGGSHNGMKNIVQMLSAEDIARIRLGIGNIKHPNQDLSTFVLGRFSSEEEQKLGDIFIKTEKKLLEFLDK